MDLLRISWDATLDYCEQLAKKIEFRPDIIIGITRGGLVPARVLSDILDVRTVGILGIEFYKSMGKTAATPTIFQEIGIDLKGKKVLIVDDVADTGRSLMVAKDHIKSKGAKEIKVATIHYKPNSIFKPDYFVKTETAWICYPWERHETEREIAKERKR